MMMSSLSGLFGASGSLTPYLFLALAVGFEVAGTLMLQASQQFTRIVPTVALGVCYAISFYLFTLTLKSIPLGVVYASWSGLGVFTVAVLGYLVFDQSLSWQVGLGLLLIVIGVVIVNVYSSAPV